MARKRSPKAQEAYENRQRGRAIYYGMTNRDYDSPRGQRRKKDAEAKLFSVRGAMKTLRSLFAWNSNPKSGRKGRGKGRGRFSN